MLRDSWIASTPVRALTYDRHSHYDNAKDAASYFASHLNAASGLAATYSGRAKAPTGQLGIGGPTGATGPALLSRYAGHRLDVIIRAMFFPSDDEIAETLFRHVAVATGYAPTMAGHRSRRMPARGGRRRSPVRAQGGRTGAAVAG